jgi:WD40 repeat protein
MATARPETGQAADAEDVGAAAGYDGFISYSHAVDGRLAPELQSALQRFAKPWYRVRALRIFRDDANLAADPGLWSAIVSALSRSRWFLLLASPTAAASPWVEREARYWLENKPLDRLLIVLTDGQLAWDAAGRAFDERGTTALPASLCAAFGEEPRFVDLRWAHRHEHLSLRDPRFRSAVADLAAPLRQQPKDELIGEEIRQHRRAVRLARGAVAVLVALTVAATISAVLAVRGQHAARVQRDRARRQAQIATSRQLAAESGASLRTADVDVALLLAAHGYRLWPTTEARDALLAGLSNTPRLVRIVQTGAAAPAALSSDGRTVATLSATNALEIRRLGSSRPLHQMHLTGEPIRVDLSPDGSVAAVGERSGAVSIFKLDRGADHHRFGGPPQPPGEEGPFQGSSFAIAPHGRLVAWNGAQISLWNGRELTHLSPGIKPYSWLLALSSDGTRLAAGSDADGTVVVWRLGADGVALGKPTTFDAGSGRSIWGDDAIASLAFDPADPRTLAVGGLDGTVAFWDAARGRLLAKKRAGIGSVGPLVFTADGARLASTAEGQVRLWDVRRRAPLLSVPLNGFGSTLAFLDSAHLAAGGTRGVAVWDVNGSPLQLGRRLHGNDAGVSRLAYDPSGKTIATLGEDDIRLWSQSTLKPLGEPLPTGTQAVDLVVSPDGATIAAWPSAGAPVALWSTDGRRTTIRDLPHVDDVAFADDGKAVAATSALSGTSAITTWNLDPRRQIAKLEGSRGAGGPVDLAPGARRVTATVGGGTHLRLWDTTSGGVVANLVKDPAAAAFSRDGRMLAASSLDDGRIGLWDAGTGRAVGRLSGKDSADALAFDPTGHLLATVTTRFTAGGKSVAVQLWDVRHRRRLGTQDLASGSGRGFEDQPQLDFSADGKSLAVLGLDARPLVLSLDPDMWIAIACRTAGRELTPKEWAAYVGAVFPYRRVC